MAEPLLDEQIAAYLKTLDYSAVDPSFVPANQITFAEEPDSPDNVVTVYEEAGGARQHRFGEKRACSVRVRHNSYATGKSLAQFVGRALHELQDAAGSATIAGLPVGRISADFSVIHLGRAEDRTRHLFTQTFTAISKQLAP